MDRVVGHPWRSLRTFARRNPLSAFWGGVAALIIIGVTLVALAPAKQPVERVSAAVV